MSQGQVYQALTQTSDAKYPTASCGIFGIEQFAFGQINKFIILKNHIII